MAVTRLNQANEYTGLPRREGFCPRPDQVGSNFRIVPTRDGNDRITQFDLYVQEEDGTETQYQQTITRDGAGLITEVGEWSAV